jgi:hypothetical protein
LDLADIFLPRSARRRQVHHHEYGDDSRLTAQDRADLTKLYRTAWTGELAQINGTEIKFVKPFHTIGESAENVVAVGQIQNVVESPRRRRKS